MQTDPAWKDNLIFSEYFHGDNGAAIGAFHQTGWTGLIADLILRRHGAVRSLGDVLRDLASEAGHSDDAVTSHADHRGRGRPGRPGRPGCRATAALPGTPFPLGATPGEQARRRGHELRDRLVRRRQRHLVPVRRGRRGNPDPGAGQRRRRLARVRAGHRPGAGLRVPGRRARGTRPGACGATRPSCCSTRTPRRSADRSPSGPRCSARTRPTRPGRAPWTPPGTCPAAWSWTPAFGWQDEKRPWHRYADTVLYEIHVKGFTMRHPDIPPELRGTYAGLAHEAAIAYLTGLGVTAVELLPVHQNVPEAFLIAAGPDQLLGLQHDRLLRAAQRLLRRRPGRPARRPGRRVQGDGRRAAPGRPGSGPRRGVQPHRRGRAGRPRAVLPRHRQPGVLPDRARRPRRLLSTPPAAATR